MAFYRNFVKILFGCSILLAVSAWSLEQDSGSKSTAIPVLPPVERSSPVIKTTEDKSDIILTKQSSENTSLGFPRYLSALQLDGYLRLRGNIFRNGHLKTHAPGVGGTSNFLPNLSAYEEDSDGSAPNPDQNNYSANMRLRLNPTINISELTRIKTTVDIFDNLVLGSTPNYLRSPAAFLSMSQDPASSGINQWQNTIALKRAWGEANFPIGELRFGRMPMNWGLGILYNSGDSITSDYGDQIDGVMFTTRLFDHFVTPSYSIAYTGPSERGGGFFKSPINNISHRLWDQSGQKYARESSDIAHVFSLSFLKRDSDFITDKKIAESKAIFNYGLFASYRFQDMDSHIPDPKDNKLILVKRDGHIGMGSLWTSLSYKTFHIEAELAGIWGKYRRGEKNDPLALAGQTSPQSLWLLQGGIALESRLGFLDDRLQVGLDAGVASAQSGPGFGTQEEKGVSESQKNPSAGKYKSNFKFNPAYTVDLLLYREILGGISGTYYFKPHVSYFFSRNFGLRGDAISSFALDKSNTSGDSNLLGIELDASAFLRTENGFYFSLAYGVLFPLKGLNHSATALTGSQHKLYGSAQVAQTLQLYLGLLF
jgi:uncharacterized protein (TIGR04551 family)